MAVKYKCAICGEKRHGGFEVIKSVKKWVCHICFVEKDWQALLEEVAN